MTTKEGKKIVRHPAPVALSKDEIMVYANELGEVLNKEEMLAQMAKSAGTEYRHRLKELRQRISELGEIIRSRKEMRNVECFEVPDTKEGCVEIYRVDTGERLHARELTDADRQMDL